MPYWRLAKRTILYIDRLCGKFLQHAIIAVSEDLAAALAIHLPVAKIDVIENGIEIPDHHVPHTIEKKTSPIRFGIAGRLVSVKRIDLCIRAAKYLHDVHPDFEASFHIYGGGPLQRELDLR